MDTMEDITLRMRKKNTDNKNTSRKRQKQQKTVQGNGVRMWVRRRTKNNTIKEKKQEKELRTMKKVKQKQTTERTQHN